MKIMAKLTEKQLIRIKRMVSGVKSEFFSPLMIDELIKELEVTRKEMIDTALCQ